VRIERSKGALLSALVIASLITPLLLLSPSPVHATLTPHDPINIWDNAAFTPVNGVVSGSGTENDPYIIENWDISAKTATGIHIRNTTAHFVIRNCYLHDGWKDGGGYDGIFFYNVMNGKIDNNLLNNNATGIDLGVYSDHNLISNNLLENNFFGITVQESSNNIISNNTVENSKGWDGIYLYESDNNLISNNIVRNTYYYLGGLESSSIILHLSDSNFISNNIVENSNHGIYFRDRSRNNRISNNIVRNIDPYEGIGLFFSSSYNTVDNNLVENSIFGVHLFVSSDNNTLTNNTCRNNDNGIYLSRSSNNVIKNNTCENNSYGIYIQRFYGASYNNHIYHNNFVNNDNQAYDDGSNYWDDGYPSGGNYWSDYTGIDANGDGIGDTPYVIPPGYNQDRYPLIRNTLPGENVQVTPTPGVSVTFSTVTAVGNTAATTSTTGPAPPTGYKIIENAGQPIYYDITTTAAYSGPITVCISYDETQVAGPEANLKLMHKVDNFWEDITTSVDTVNNKIYGTTTSLSIFIVASPTAPVGGIAFPVDKLTLLAPYIILAALIAIGTVSVAVYWRRYRT
jgi:parallel beta-helix repeat protein